MATKKRSECVSRIGKVINLRDELQQSEQTLRNGKSIASIVFFDLVGSTDYRIHHSQERGLEKAFRHNVIVSDAVRRHGGVVAKWLGDGVMAYFSKDDDKPDGPSHCVRALHAASAALRELENYNLSIANEPDHEIHTKAGISSGPVHYIELQEESEPRAPTSRLDPMGTPVDLAARLQSMASMDTIVIDAITFFGSRYSEAASSGLLPLIGSDNSLSSTPSEEVNWHALKIEGVRRTSYSVSYSVFALKADGLVASRRGSEKNGPWTESRFVELARTEVAADSIAEKAVFVSKPVRTNVRGFALAIPALAVRFSISEAPIVEHAHNSDTSMQARHLFGEAESLIRENPPQAQKRLRDFLAKDSRSARAHFHLGVMHRMSGEHRQAMESFTRALECDPTSGMVWKMVGLSAINEHFQKSNRDGLDLAIGALAQARYRAWIAYDFDMERCCDAYLAFAYYMRGDPGDSEHAEQCVSEFMRQIPTRPFHVFMSKVLFVLMNKENKASACENELLEADKLLESVKIVEDTLLDVRDLRKMLAQTECKFKMAKIN